MLTVFQDPELARLLQEYSQAGGVIDYVVFTGLQDRVASPAEHREAALLAMDEIKRQIERPPSCFTLRVLHPPGEPRLITAREFAGPFYDWRTEALVSPWSKGEVDPSPLQEPPREPAYDFATRGYAQAFGDPPHGLWLQGEPLNELFTAINDRLWGGLHEALDVRSWPTDWCNYFDEGHEWWGSFYWTVHSERTGLLVTVAASSTD
ncbi:MAG TPA: hypothetical protein VL025_09415 [Thermoanaerobaculia bacterium]|nr:hypothetical protein [Thermoanaerobaculia bacterium]